MVESFKARAKAKGQANLPEINGNENFLEVDPGMLPPPIWLDYVIIKLCAVNCMSMTTNLVKLSVVLSARSLGMLHCYWQDEAENSYTVQGDCQGEMW